MFRRRVETTKSETSMGKQNEFLRKYTCVFSLLLIGFSFTIKECDGLKPMLSHLKPLSGIQTSLPVSFHCTLNSLD